MQILLEIVETYHERGVQVYFIRLRERPLSVFKKAGLLDLVDESHRFKKVSDAIEAIELDMAKRGVYE